MRLSKLNKRQNEGNKCTHRKICKYVGVMYLITQLVGSKELN